MPVQPNYNKLVYLKKFNNYFNRKIYGGSSLDDYFNGESGVSYTKTKTFGKNDISDFSDGDLTYVIFKSTILDLPIGIEIINNSISVENDGGYITTSGDLTYFKDKRIVEILFGHTASSVSDFPDNIKITLEYTYINREYFVAENINFNRNDEVVSEVVGNDVPFNPDYLLVLDPSNDEIVSRWFVIKQARIRDGQFQYALKRDVIYDKLDTLLDAPIYVHKGMLEESDPFVVNSEGMTVNQVKKSEIPLQDETANAFVVGYFAKNTPATTVNGDLGLKVDIPANAATVNGQEYKMFVMFLNDYDESLGGVHSFALGGVFTKMMVSAISQELASELYDLQLLPYFPLMKLRDENGNIALDSLSGVEMASISQQHSTGSTTGTALLDISNFVITESGGVYTAKAKLNPEDLNLRRADVMGTITIVDADADITIQSQTATIVSNAFEVVLTFNSLPSYIKVRLTATATAGGSDLHIATLFFVKEASFEVDIYGEINSSLSKKESSNLELYRLVSPNYQGSFEINIAKNNNSLKKFKAYCTYKPYTPYIKVAPEFEFLYGQNFGDCRGLICGGDFSLPRITDAWRQYQLENKNYQNIFNREIQNLEFNQSIEMRNQIISAVVGHFTGTIAGAAGGAAMGSVAGPYGAAIGAIVGGAIGGTASLVSGIVDTITLYQQQREQKSLMIDKYNYQLGNIQALPYTLTKVSAFDISSKIWPFVERYCCTDEEIQVYRDKIEFESMTVMRIDHLSNYVNKYNKLCYFKGELIRNDLISEETYFLEAIYAELMKGVYI